jgi:hypothetical protein
MESMYKIAEASANFILYFMGFLSIVSLAIIIERYLTLRKISKNSAVIGAEFDNIIVSPVNDVAPVPPNAILSGSALQVGTPEPFVVSIEFEIGASALSVFAADA